MTRFTTLLGTTAIFATAALAPAAMAMHADAEQLQAVVETELNAMNIAAIDASALTVSQLAQIHAVLESEDTEESKASQIEVIANVEKNFDYPDILNGVNGTSSLEDIVQNKLMPLGVEVEAKELSVVQLVQIVAVLEAETTDSAKKREIDVILTQ